MTDYSRLLQNLGIAELNTIQKNSLAAFDPLRDLVLYAPTGSGKTLAFLLCLLQRLRTDENSIQAVIIVPTRELAQQIDTVIRKMNTGYRVACVYGGHSVREESRTLEVTPAILAGTPGRLLDLMHRKIISVKTTHTLVLDEFDKSLEMGFEKEMTAIASYMQNVKTKILTSATVLKQFPDFLKLQNPIVVNGLDASEDSDLANRMHFSTVHCKDTEKMEAAFSLACNFGAATSIFFCNHRDAVDRLSAYFKQHRLMHAVFHGGFEQHERERALISFSNGSCPVLIATDLAARGLDIAGVEHVVHFQLPSDEKALTHRNGRTARAGKTGNVWFLLTEREFLPPGLPGEPDEKNWSSARLIVPEPQWITLYFNLGKKDKITKTDLVGFLCQTAKLDKQDIGLINVLERSAYAAVKKKVFNAKQILQGNQRIKKQQVRIQLIH